MNIQGPFTRISFEEMNLNSHDQVKDYLLSVGWQPTQWNYKKEGKRWVYDDRGDKIKTSPKLTEDSFPSVKGEIPRLIVRRSVLNHRRSLISNLRDPENKGWLSHIRENGRIPACGIPQATPTGRWRHSVIVNCPSAKSIYGPEVRSLFTVDPGRVMVGVDATAIEARCQAHNIMPYTGGVEYAKLLLEGDIHARNASLFECTRDEAKSPYYALLFGASAGKVSETLGVDARRGQELFDQFWDGNQCLRELKAGLEVEFNSHGGKRGGYIRGLDGRKLYGRSAHSLVNLKLQSDAAILFKTAMTFLFSSWVPKRGLDAKLVMNFHDEMDADVAECDVEEYLMLALKSFEAAGRYYNYRVPIIGAGKVGEDWFQVH